MAELTQKEIKQINDEKDKLRTPGFYSVVYLREETIGYFGMSGFYRKPMWNLAFFGECVPSMCLYSIDERNIYDILKNDSLKSKMEISNNLYHNIRFLDGWNCFDVIPHTGKYHIELFQGDSVLISIRKVFITDKGEHRLTNEYSFEISNVKEIRGRFAILENGTEINRVSNFDVSKYTVFTSRFYDSRRSYRLATHLFTRTKSITNIY